MSSSQTPSDDARPEDAPPSSNTQTGDTNTSTSVPGPTPSTSRGSVSSFIFASIMLFMLMNGGDDLVAQSHYRDSLRSLRWQQANFTDWLHGLVAPNFTMVCLAIKSFAVVGLSNMVAFEAKARCTSGRARSSSHAIRRTSPPRHLILLFEYHWFRARACRNV